MKEFANIDELLNGFIDGELNQRQLNEVHRLVDNDPDIAKRLKELRSCKAIVGSLPVTNAPVSMLDDIKASLERKTLLGHNSRLYEDRLGVRHLMLRKVVSAAAMFVLVAFLAVVVYRIVAPVEKTKHPVAVKNKVLKTETSLPASNVAPSEPVKENTVAAEIAKQEPFNGSLEIKASNPAVVVAFINRAIENNIPADQWTAASDDKRSPHILACSRGSLNILLSEMENIWNRLNSVTLLMETEQENVKLAVNAVTSRQILDIVSHDTRIAQVENAKQIASLNKMSPKETGQSVTVNSESKEENISIPKPVLTSGEKPVVKSEPLKEEEKIHLVITVVPAE